jgi:lipoate-protein ligase B
MREPMAWRWLGLSAYERALAVQTATWNARQLGGPDVCLALEHPPTITLGRRATLQDLRVTADDLARRGVGCYATERGGAATYHAPGQLVLYPVVGLAERGLGVRRFVWLLEAIMIDVAASVGVVAQRDPRGHGVWTDRGKLGAVGIRVRDGVSLHGLALNVDLDLSGYALITPCGLPDMPVTSLRREGATATVTALLPAARDACRRRLEGMPAARFQEARV